MKILLTFGFSLFCALPSLAGVGVSFIESAPKDRFVLTNVGACDLAVTQVRIDLSGAPAGLIFDVTGSGPGVGVFQPLQIVTGQILVSNVTDVSDGDKSITLYLESFAMGQSVAFTIDVDDTNGAHEITVLDREIRGATVTIATNNGAFSAAFRASSELVVHIPGCAA
jgi:hypothetical protein